MKQKMDKILVYIPARSGSKRIPGKNTKIFCGKPLIIHTIEQALSLSFVDKVLVDTDSPEIADMAKQNGAEALFLRPARLAQDSSVVIDSILYTLDRLKKENGYTSTHIMILQTTSPLREIGDIEACRQMMQKTDATTILTVCPTHPKLYHLSSENDTILVNGSENQSNNTQTWELAYLLNGCMVYIVEIGAMYQEHRIITEKTKAVVVPKWRSIDLDTVEEWAMAELLYKNREEMYKRIQELEQERKRI